MIELAIIGSLIIGVVIFILMRTKESVTYSGVVTMESIKEVAKLITHESFISDFVTICNTKGKEIALLHIDAKVQITFNLERLQYKEVKEGAYVIDYIPEPEVVAIENNFFKNLNDENFIQTEFILLEKSIYISRTNIEKIERAFFENYKERPSVVKEIYQAKQNFLKDINAFAEAMGSGLKVEFSEKLKEENKIIKKELASFSGNPTKIIPFIYTVPNNEIEASEAAVYEYNKLLLFIFLASVDSELNTKEKEYLNKLIDKSILLEKEKDKLKKIISNNILHERINKGLKAGIDFVMKYSGLESLSKNEQLSKIGSGMKNITKFTKLDKISNFIFSDSDLSPNFDLLKQDKDAAEEIIDTMLVISSLDKNISQEEIEFIYEVAKMLDVKKEVIEENLINISNIEKGK